MSDAQKIKQEIEGLTAKLRWDHVQEGMKDVWRARIEQLKKQLARLESP